MPLGTGRTDVYLFPSYALLVAVAVAEVAAMLPPRSGRHRVTTAVLVAAVSVAPRLGTQRYPEDLTRWFASSRTLAARRADRRVPECGLRLRDRDPISDQTPAGCAPADGLGGQGAGPGYVLLEPHREDPEAWAGALDQLSARSPRIWLLGSHFFSGLARAQGDDRARGYRAAGSRAGTARSS